MNKGCKKIFISTLLLSLTLGFNAALADSYKNSLLKVELLKKPSGSYGINLYTQKRYSEPVKVIKKSDYSYYILLPETKNSAIKTSAPSGDIRNVSVSLHPYAGQDVSSGYTKINISTTKPINFELDVKQLSQSSTQKQTAVAQNSPSNANQALQNITLAKEAQKEPAKENIAQNSQKKNSDSFQDSKKITLAQAQTTQTKTHKQNSQKQTTAPIKQHITVKTADASAQKHKEAPKPLQNSKSNAQKIASSQKITQTAKTAPTGKIAAQKPEQNTQKQIPIPSKTRIANAKPETKPAQNPISSESLNFAVKQGEEKQISKTTNEFSTISQKNIEKEIDNQSNTELNNENPKTAQTSEELENNETKTAAKPETNFEKNFDKLKQNVKKTPVYLGKIKNALSQKLDDFGLSFGDFALICGTSLFAFLLILFLLTRKQPKTVKIRKREELFEEKTETKETEKEKSSDEKSEGEFFVFDENVKQTRLQADNSAKNFELSSFEPDITINYKKDDKNYAYDSSNEYEIIQKILKEDSSIEIEPPAISKKVEDDKPIKQNETQKQSVQTIEQNSKDNDENAANTINETENKPESFESLVKEAQEIKNSEKEEEKAPEERPKVLSSVEIAPERGFMCVSYNNNINLMGYIFDDVFALHNFKREKLKNYDIKFRLSDKDDKGANFIVKIDDSKMVIRATKLKMTKEVLM